MGRYDERRIKRTGNQDLIEGMEEIIMINTEIFSYESYNNYTCFEEVLKDVNELIKEREIKKEDIVEYRTENWKTVKDREDFWHYRVTISWWQ